MEEQTLKMSWLRFLEIRATRFLISARMMLKSPLTVYAKEAALLVAEGKADRGIVCCGSGIGVSIASNRVRGVRCALCMDENMAELSRRHNDANMLALGGRLLDVEKAKRIMESWLETKFEGGRHKRRIDMIDGI